MYSHQESNSNGGLAPKIGLVLGQSWMLIPMNKLSPIVCKCISTIMYVDWECCCLHEKYIVYKELCPEVFSFVFYCEDCYCLHVYYIVYQDLNTQVHIGPSKRRCL